MDLKIGERIGIFKIKIINKQNILSLIISLYFSFVSTFSLKIDRNNYHIVIWLGLSVLLFPIFKYILNKTKQIHIKTNDNEKMDIKEFFLYLIIIGAFFIFYFIALFPGGQSPDTLNQWNQAIKNSYNDWHPVLHTFLFFKIPSLIVKDYIFVVIWQLAILAIILAIVCYNFRQLGFSKKTTLCMLILILINPYNARMINVAWKDVSYSFILLLTTVIMIFIVKSDGIWLNNKKNLIMVSIILFLMIGLRHNGIICFIGIISSLLLFYYKQWKSIFIILLSVIAIFFVIKIPIFKLCNVERHTAVFTESMGIPLNQISYILNNDGILTEENEIYLNKIANLEIWKKKYNKKSFNNIKWDKESTKFNIINDNPTEFMKNYFNLVKNNLGLAFESYYNVTSAIWSIEDAKSEIGPIAADFRYESEEGKIYKISDKFNYILNKYDIWLNDMGIGKVLFGYGGSLFIMALSIIIISNSGKFYFKKYLPFVPILSNTLVIMFLITGGEHRFVYSQVLGAIPLLFYGISDITKKMENPTKYALLYYIDKKNRKIDNNKIIKDFKYKY